MNERSYSIAGYKYGFNGQEKLNEVKGVGNHNTALFWEYDTRIGQRWNIDPKPNPMISPYSTFANNPIWYSDVLGDTIKINNLVYTPGMKYNGSDKFEANAINDLNKIYNIDKGKSRIDDLISSKHDYIVTEAASLNSSRFSYEETESGGGTISYSQKGGIIDGVSYNKSYYTLGHELQHAWDRDQGQSFYLTSKSNGVTLSEHNAVAFENYLRASAGESLMRREYDGKMLYRNKNADYFLRMPDPLRKTESIHIPQFRSDSHSDNTVVKRILTPILIDNNSGQPKFK